MKISQNAYKNPSPVQSMSKPQGGMLLGGNKISDTPNSMRSASNVVSANDVKFHDSGIHLSRLGYTINREPGSRVSFLEFDENHLSNFYSKIEKDFDRDPFHSHKHVPYERFFLAEKLSESVGDTISNDINQILQDWELGCCRIILPEVFRDEKSILAVQTALAYLIGNTRCDSTGSHMAFMSMNEQSKSAPPLINPLNDLSFHTDGTFYGGATDWLLFSKLHDNSDGGGESTLIHIKDWKDYKTFKENDMSDHLFEFKGPQGNDPRRQHLGDRGDSGVQRRPLFFQRKGGDSFRFTYQWVFPKTLAEARYLKKISESLKKEESKSEFKLPAGHMYLINNNTWLHGRKAFNVSDHLDRKACRMFGSFSD